MRSVGAYEAKANLSKLLEAVEAGESITITRNGKAVAEIRPIDRRARARQAIAAITQLRRGLTLGGISVRELVEHGRKQ